jgi:hypothetical protein
MYCILEWREPNMQTKSDSVLDSHSLHINPQLHYSYPLYYSLFYINLNYLSLLLYFLLLQFVDS